MSRGRTPLHISRAYLYAALLMLQLAPSIGPAGATEAEEIRAFVASWAEAWQTRDIGRYLACYAPSFDPGPSFSSLSAWKKQRQRRILGSRNIHLLLHDMRLRHVGDQWRVTFFQEYRSASYSDRVFKELRLIRTGHGWRIQRERAVPILRGL